MSQMVEDEGKNVTVITALGFGNIYDTSFTTDIYFQTSNVFSPMLFISKRLGSL